MSEKKICFKQREFKGGRYRCLTPMDIIESADEDDEDDDDEDEENNSEEAEESDSIDE